MTAKVLSTPQAERDLVEIGLHIAQDSRRAADRMLGVIAGKFKTLARSPKLGRRRDELSANLRSFPAGPYVVFYRAVRGGVEIIRVLHGARDIASEFE